MLTQIKVDRQSLGVGSLDVDVLDVGMASRQFRCQLVNDGQYILHDLGWGQLVVAHSQTTETWTQQCNNYANMVTTLNNVTMGQTNKG